MHVSIHCLVPRDHIVLRATFGCAKVRGKDEESREPGEYITDLVVLPTAFSASKIKSDGEVLILERILIEREIRVYCFLLKMTT